MNRMIQGEELDRLILGVDPRARLPRGFGFWSPTLQTLWLKQNQKKAPRSRKKKETIDGNTL